MNYNITINIKLHKFYIIINIQKVFGILLISLVLLYTFLMTFENKSDENDYFITNT